ncbi:MAG: hypothetical protein F4Z24_04835, partial [Nitrospira sp. SB0666_bin_27]|nr:hypothetical protein [Nitrospira sp. SB0666_bin_27]MYF24788.1 hypothetical protein [Nitrospira sp. SB0678_bin_10]
MRVGHHQNKSFIIAALTAVVVVGVMLTMGQVPLAVSQPVTIPVGSISGPIPMDAANPVWETV